MSKHNQSATPKVVPYLEGRKSGSTLSWKPPLPLGVARLRQNIPAAIGFIYRLLCFLHLVASCWILLHLVASCCTWSPLKQPWIRARAGHAQSGEKVLCRWDYRGTVVIHWKILHGEFCRLNSKPSLYLFVSLHLSQLMSRIWQRGMQAGWRLAQPKYANDETPRQFSTRAIFDIFSARQIRRLTVPASYIQNRFCQAKVCRPRRRKGRGLGIWAKHVKNQ